MGRPSILSIAAMAACLCMSCAEQRPDPVTVTRLDQALAEYASLDSVARMQMRDSLGQEIHDFFLAMDRPQPSDWELMAWSAGDVVKAFQPVVDDQYPDLDDLQQQLGYIIDNAQAQGIELPDLRFTAVTWGKPQPLMRIGNDMLIALNHYLGEDFEGYSHLDAYRRAEKAEKMLPYDIAGALVSTQYPFRMNESPTLLNWMLYEGALVEAKMSLVDNAQLHLALGYTPAQLELLEDNFQEMWREMATKKMVHSTDPALADRMLSAAPFSPLLGNKAPGRSGRYIGYILIREYLKKHPGTTLPDLLSPNFYTNPNTRL